LSAKCRAVGLGFATRPGFLDRDRLTLRAAAHRFLDRNLALRRRFLDGNTAMPARVDHRRRVSRVMLEALAALDLGRADLLGHPRRLWLCEFLRGMMAAFCRSSWWWFELKRFSGLSPASMVEW
jgi:hypothetical protein